MTPLPIADRAQLHERVTSWFDAHARELPWRSDPHPWAVMVSEFMLQQTPVARVLPVFDAHGCSAGRPRPPWPPSSTGEAVRAWGRLGYPRRALRLHAAATAIVERHDGRVPSERRDLLALPGVGDYTAGAIASFAFADRQVVLDTNVRRVLRPRVSGEQFPADAVTAPNEKWPTGCFRPTMPRVGRGDMESVPSSARLELPDAVSARCRTCAGGALTDTPRTRPRRVAVRRGPAPTGSAVGRLLAALRDSHQPVPKETVGSRVGRRSPARALPGQPAPRRSRDRPP